MAAIWLQNLAFYSLQIGVLALTGALLLRVLQIRIPNIRLVSWQLLIAVCILLPAIQPWLTAKSNAEVQISLGPARSGDASHGSHGIRLPLADVALLVIGAGIAIRFGILALGVSRLRRYRRDSTFVPNAFADLQQRLGVFADVQVSDDVAGPVTFGVLRPVILMPESCLQDQSIACHELLHVRRRDWLYTVVEECILSIFWFHPAIWWMMAEIQLAREEAVDREVVAMLNSREAYLESLLTSATSRAGLDLVPASQFLRKRHLQKRITALLKEVSMSRFRLTSSLAAFAAVLTVAAWLGVRAFPLQAAPQEKDASNITVHAGSIPLLHRAAVQYSKEAQAKRIEGTVALELSLSEAGTVTDARVLNGPEELRGAALQSVLDWHYAHDTALPPKIEVSIDFKLSSPDSLPRTLLAPPAEQARLDALFLSLPDTIKQQVENRLTVKVGDRITQAVLNEIEASLNAVDEHLKFVLRPNTDKTGSIIKVWLESAGTPGDSPKKIRVGGNVQAQNLIHKVQPLYPPEAKENRVQGSVRFTVMIGKDGKVQNLTLVSGDPVLAEAAREAVQQWIYKPTLLNGDPVEVVTLVDVNFTLSQ